MNSDQIILQLATPILDPFLSFKMCEESVEEKELRFSARDGASYVGQIMQLSKSAGEGRFTALVQAGDDNDALLVFQIEVVAHDGFVFASEFMGQGEIKSSIVIYLLALARDARKTKS